MGFFCVSFSRKVIKVKSSGFTKFGAANKGQPFGFTGILVGAKGDWKFEKEFFEQTRSWASTLVCPFDNAQSGGDEQPCPYVDMQTKL